MSEVCHYVSFAWARTRRVARGRPVGRMFGRHWTAAQLLLWDARIQQRPRHQL